MGLGNCDFEMRCYKDPLLGGEEGKTNYGSEFAMADELDGDDEAFKLFEAWCCEIEDTREIWLEDWAQKLAAPR